MNMIFVRSATLYLLLFYLGNVTGADSCGGYKKGKGGRISFPEIVSDYPPNTDCTWYVDAPYNADSIMVTFSRFDISDWKTVNRQTYRRECDDYLQILGADNFKVMNLCDKPYNGQLDLLKKQIQGNKMTVHFHSDDVNTGKGFSLTWAVNKWRSTTPPPITSPSSTTAAVVTTKKTTTQPTTTKTTKTTKRPTTTKTTATSKQPTTTKTTTTTKRPTTTKTTATSKRPTTTKATTTAKRPTTTKTAAKTTQPTMTKPTTTTKRPTTKTAAKTTQPTMTKPTTTTNRPTTKTAATTTQPTTTKSTATTAQLTRAKTTATTAQLTTTKTTMTTTQLTTTKTTITTTQPATTKTAATTKRPTKTKSRETTKLPTTNKSTTTFTQDSFVTSEENVTIGEETLDIDPSSDIIIYVSAFLAIETCLSVGACVLWRSRRRRRKVVETESCSEDIKRSEEFVSNLHMPPQRSSMFDDNVKKFGVLTTAHEYEEIPLGNMLNSIENEDLYIDNESQYDVLRKPRQKKTNQKTNNIYGHLVL